MPDRPTSSLYVLRTPAGLYLLTGRAGALDVSTPDPLPLAAALRHARALAPLLAVGEVRTSNVAAGDLVVAALCGGKARPRRRRGPADKLLSEALADLREQVEDVEPGDMAAAAVQLPARYARALHDELTRRAGR